MLARRQHGVVARRQLRELGLSDRAIDRRIASGRLHPVHNGVFAVGHLLIPPEGRWMAAVLACGSEALLSHRSAAGLWGILPAREARVEITVPGTGVRQRRGVLAHRARDLRAEDRAIREGVPVTAIARTLLDLAEVLSHVRLRRAFEAAERLRVLDVRKVREILDRSPGRRGAGRLQALLDEATEPPDPRSELEQRFFELCVAAGLPRPVLNATVAGWEVDVLWPRHRLVVELDGFAYHRGRAAFERDRRRDLDLQVARHRVVRITEARVRREPVQLIASIQALLAEAEGGWRAKGEAG